MLALDSMKQVRIVDLKADSAIILVTTPNQSQPVQQEIQLTLFPNPANHQIQLYSSEHMTNYSIVNSFGRIVLQNKVSRNKYQMVDIGLLPKGLYYLIAETPSGKAGKPFVKQ